MTLGAWLDKGEAALRAGPHPEKARRDAELLLLYAAGMSRSAFLAHSGDELDLAAATHYEVLLERRREGEPIQYITGACEFYGLPFRVTPDVLIPRPETEHLVERVLGLASQRLYDRPLTRALGQGCESAIQNGDPTMRELRILDIGTGSGTIAVTLAHKLPDAQITAIDLSAAA